MSVTVTKVVCQCAAAKRGTDCMQLLSLCKSAWQLCINSALNCTSAFLSHLAELYFAATRCVVQAEQYTILCFAFHSSSFSSCLTHCTASIAVVPLAHRPEVASVSGLFICNQLLLHASLCALPIHLIYQLESRCCFSFAASLKTCFHVVRWSLCCAVLRTVFSLAIDSTCFSSFHSASSFDIRLFVYFGRNI